jgi:hypothetical protein
VVPEYAMPTSTEKSREYLRMAAENDQRASKTENPELKAIFLEIASEFRELAELINDPEQWRARLIASGTPKQK